MSLKARLQDDVKTAMKAGDKKRLGTLRMTMAAIKQREVDERIELSDADINAILEKMVKQRREAKAQYDKAGRTDLSDQEAYEITVLAEFLPKALSSVEVDKLVNDCISQAGAESVRDMGKVMGLIKSQATGSIDMQAVSTMVREKLNS
ncbi:MAG: GatB/YqeY domain-containing protein [bacterium]